MTLDFLLLFTAGCIAGAMNAVAGGGSFVTFPTMVFVGLPSVAANASSTVALVPGTLASVWTYATGRHRIGFVDIGGVALPLLTGVSVAGGLMGAWLLLSTPLAVFDAVIPWLLLLATLALLFGAQAGAWLRGHVRLGAATVLPVQFLLGIYGGYFGGAVGIMMLAAWSLIDGYELKTLNPTRMLVVGATNAIAVIYFVVAREVWWPQTLVLLAGGIVGGYAGARVGQRLPPRVARAIVISITVGMTLAFFKRAYL